MEFTQHLINGVSLGSIYALIALGYTLVFGVLRLINFAHGEVMMLGAFIGYYFARALGIDAHPSAVGLIATLVVAMVGSGLIGVIVERVAYRPLRRAPRINLMITAVGVSLLFQYSAQLGFGAEPRFFPPVINLGENWKLGELLISPVQVLILAISIVLMLGLHRLVFRTRFGRAMRAVSFSEENARLQGIPTDRVISLTFFIGSALAGAAGVLVGLIYPSIEPLMGVGPGLKAFAAAVLGGIGNVVGAVVGAAVLGLAEEMIVAYGVPSFRDALAFGLLILVLIVRPTGLLGGSRTEKV